MKTDFTLLRAPKLDTINEVISKHNFPIKTTNAELTDMVFVIKNNKLVILHDNKDIKNFSYVWLSANWNDKDLGYALEIYLKYHNTPVSDIEKNTSKITDHTVFALNNINTPNTIILDITSVNKHIELIEQTCTYPIIVKDVKGHGGNLIKLAHNRDELFKKTQELPQDKRFLFQEFIPNEYDWGIIVVNGKVQSGEKSYPAPGEFRNNAVNGAKEVFVPIKDIPKKAKELAIQSCKALEIPWGRADIIYDEKSDTPYLLETNRVPGITSNSSEATAAYNFISSEINNKVN